MIFAVMLNCEHVFHGKMSWLGDHHLRSQSNKWSKTHLLPGTMYICMHACMQKECSMCICRYARRHQPLYAKKASHHPEAQELQWVFASRENSSWAKASQGKKTFQIPGPSQELPKLLSQETCFGIYSNQFESGVCGVPNQTLKSRISYKIRSLPDKVWDWFMFTSLSMASRRVGLWR